MDVNRCNPSVHVDSSWAVYDLCEKQAPTRLSDDHIGVLAVWHPLCMLQQIICRQQLKLCSALCSSVMWLIL